MLCNCEKLSISSFETSLKHLKMSNRHRLRWSNKDIFVTTILLLFFFLNKVSCNSLPAETTANKVSDKSTQRYHFNPFSGDHESSSEIGQSYEDDSFGNEDATIVDEQIAHLYAEQTRNYSKTTQEPAHTPYMVFPSTIIPPPACSGLCSDKQARENAALDSFKKQLLARLGMEHTPNVTKYRKLPDSILEEFCKRTNLPPEYCTGTTSYKNYEYQSDGPRNFDEFDLDVVEEEEEVQYMSAESRIYAFANSRWFLIFCLELNILE